ncbi:MAG TPA: hypothetical protein VKV21_02940 [Solirubrobacteraceae bacterium]|nr:hypothetical protein [Solirubrobacteraceae bacterium]
MESDSALITASQNVVGQCLGVGVGVGEQCLVVADVEMRQIAEALRLAATDAGADVVLALMQPRSTHGAEPPPTVAAALAACDVFIAPTLFSLSHTQARKAATVAGARGATLPGVTADMLGRLMNGDLGGLARRSRRVADLLSAADSAELSCPLGSSMVFDLSGRDAIADDGRFTKPGAFGNFPCGEAFISPLSAEGELYASSVATFGLSSPAAHLTAVDGRLVAADEDWGRSFSLRCARGERAASTWPSSGSALTSRLDSRETYLKMRSCWAAFMSRLAPAQRSEGRSQSRSTST